MPRLGVVGFTIVAAFQVQVAAAGDLSEDVPLPGGTAAVAQSLGLPASPDRARFVAEVARLMYPAADGMQTTRARAVNSWRALRSTPQDSAEIVPIPLTAAVWSKAVFRRTIPREDIVGAILGDPRAAHLCYGLAGSDDDTLQFLADHPALITWFYENAAAQFAAFGGSLHIRDDRVVVPGGAEAAALWTGVLAEKLDRPEAFVRALFGVDQGRLAYLYDAIAELDAPRAAFALGLWTKDPSDRLTRFKALVNATRTAIPQWQPARFPFSRPPFDMANLLDRIRVELDGSPSFPLTRAIWPWLLEAFDIPLEAPRLAARPDGPVDAAWLVQSLMSDDVSTRNDRLDQLSFGQRVFGAVAEGSLSDTLVALRAFPRSRMLMLTLERMGVRMPSVYAAAARRAQQLSTLEERRQLIALQQFQGALALLWRLASVRVLDAAASERLVLSLSNVAPNGDGRYAGAIAAWLNRDLRTALVAADVRLESPMADDTRDVRLSARDDLEPALVAALAGSHGDRRRSAGSQAGRVAWEGQIYRLDFVESESHRLLRIREKQGGPRVDLGLMLSGLARKLGSGKLTAEDADRVGTDLKNTLSELPTGPDGALLRDGVGHAIAELGKAGAHTDPQRLAPLAAPLAEMADEALADALVNWAYAIAIPDADSSILLTGQVTRRHDFGLATASRRIRLTGEWALPRARVAVGVPWHVGGSLLGLDVALSASALRRVDGNRVVDAPILSTNEREAFAQAVALLDPLEMRDEERERIVSAIEAGRRRVAALSGDPRPLEAIAAAIRMDGWRQRAVQWTVVHEPERVEGLFSLTEMLYLGGSTGLNLDAWGMSGIWWSGCICTQFAAPHRWRTFVGRPQLGLMASAVPDLTLHVAATLRDLHLPAAISKTVLTAAVQDFIDEVRPTDANDWLTLVRAARTAPRERIEDYVAAATADGPLVPDVPEAVQ